MTIPVSVNASVPSEIEMLISANFHYYYNGVREFSGPRMST
jgi:hypothetical protein